MMKQVTLFKKLGSILHELAEQYEFLSQNPEQLNELELELFHANANFLADHVQIIKKLNSNREPLALPEVTATSLSEESDVEVVEPISPEPIAIESATEVIEISSPVLDLDTDKPEPVENKQKEAVEVLAEPEVFKPDLAPPSFEFILHDHVEDDQFDFEKEKEVADIFDRPLSEEEQRILAQKQIVKQKINAAPVELEEDEIGPEPFLVTEKIDEPKIEIEDLTLVEKEEPKVPSSTAGPVEDPNYRPTLNDLLAGNQNAAQLNASHSAPVKDLKQAINLNDKLLYIKDLFNGYNLAYAEAIDFANKLPNFETADQFFQKNYASKNNWADKQATVDKFYKLLNQRFKA